MTGGRDHGLAESMAPYESQRRTTWPSYAGASAYLAKLRAEATRTT